MHFWQWVQEDKTSLGAGVILNLLKKEKIAPKGQILQKGLLKKREAPIKKAKRSILRANHIPNISKIGEKPKGKVWVIFL